MTLLNFLIHKMLMMPVRIMNEEIWIVAGFGYLLLFIMVLRVFKINKHEE